MGKERLFNSNFILISVATLLMFTGFYLVMPIIARYVLEQFNADSSVAGVVASAYIITALLARPFAGYLVDKYDRRKFYLCMFSLFALLFTGYIISTTIMGLIVTRILLGATFALITTSANTLAIDVLPSSRRSDGIGYFGAIVVLAMAVGPMLGLYLIEIFSYKELFIIAALCCWMGVACGCFIRTKPRELVVKKEMMSLDRFLLREAFSVALVIAITYILYGSLMVYVSLYLNDSGLDINSGNFFLLFALGIIISRIIAGRALRRGLNDIVIKIGIVVIIVSGALFALALNEVTFPVTSVLLGIGFGALGPSIQSMIVELVPACRRGTANSTYFIALDLGSGFGMLVGGTLVQIWSYSTLYIIGAALSCVALLIYIFFARGNYQRNKAKLDVEYGRVVEG